MKTRILVNKVDSKTVNINNARLFFANIEVVSLKFNNVLAKRKWVIFDNK